MSLAAISDCCKMPLEVLCYKGNVYCYKKGFKTCKDSESSHNFVFFYQNLHDLTHDNLSHLFHHNSSVEDTLQIQ